MRRCSPRSRRVGLWGHNRARLGVELTPMVEHTLVEVEVVVDLEFVHWPIGCTRGIEESCGLGGGGCLGMCWRIGP